MKKIIIIITIFAIFLTACGTENIKNEVNDSEGKLKIVTTIFPPYDFVREIGKDKVDVSMLLKPGSESHIYEPTPQDIKNIMNADLFIYVGGENDIWVDEILSSMDDKKPEALKLVDMVETVVEETIEGMTPVEHDHGHGDSDDIHDEDDHEGEVDEHVWTSPTNAIKIVQSITNKMIEKDYVNSEFFSENSESYISKLTDLDKRFDEVVSTAKNKTFVFGDRFPFRYFAERYKLKYYAAFPGCAEETQPNARTVSFLIDKVKEENIPVVFTIEFSNEKVANSIIEATNSKKLTFHSVHNVSKEDFESNASYLTLMEKNLENLKEALN